MSLYSTMNNIKKKEKCYNKRWKYLF